MSAVRRRGTPEKRDSRRFIPGSRKKDFSSRMKIPPLSFDPQKTCGMPHVLKVAFPLIMASAGHALNLFCDRIMLGRYSAEAVAAAMPSGLTNFTISCFFIGTVGYVNSFVAQYTGAGQRSRVGVSIWQAVLIALIGGLFMASGYFWGGWLMTLFGHTDAVLQQEIVYFKLLSLFAWVPLLIGAFGAFWSGRGKTVMVMSVSFLITLLNVPFNYALIYGNWGASELGIAGAAWGTNLSALVGCAVYACFFFIPRSSRRHFNTCSHIVDWGLLWRLIRFGVPNGFQFFVDLSAFNIFVVVVGAYGKDIGAATAIAFGLNSISFTPILGIGQTVAILVGQSIGANDVHRAKKSVKSARNLTLIYMGIMAVFFVLLPEIPLALFDQRNPEVIRLTKIMLCFIAVYLLFDGMSIIYSSAVKAAGDTFFAMLAGMAMAFLGLAVPSLIFAKLGMSVWYIWGTIVVYIMMCGVVFYVRYLGGRWTHMKVIENTATLPEDQELVLKD